MSQQEIREFIGKLPQNEKDNLLAYSFADVAMNCELTSTNAVESYLKEDGKDNFDALPKEEEETEVGSDE